MPSSRPPIFFIGLRYLLSQQHKGFFSFTALISMAGLTLGVTALILVLSVFNGSQGIQRQRTLLTVPHGDIQAVPGFSDWNRAAALLESLPAISSVAPYLPVEALLSQSGYHQVSQVRGIDPGRELLASDLESSMLSGSLDALRPGEHGIVIGLALASNLRLYPGDALNLTVARSNEASNRVLLELHRFTVAGIFDVRFDIGSDLAYIHLDDAVEILGAEEAGSNLHLRLTTTDIDRAGDTVAEGVSLLREQLPGPDYSGEDWSVTEASLFNALKLEKLMTGFMLMMIVAIGAFNIVSTLVMSVAEKQADIAILRTMGAGQKTILGIFVVQGALTGVLGVLLGAVLGIALTLNFATLGGMVENLLSPDSLYLISELPAVLQRGDVLLTCSLALLISLLATLYPAWKASRIHPAEVLRYE